MKLQVQLYRLISYDFECVPMYFDNALRFAWTLRIAQDLEVLRLFWQLAAKQIKQIDEKLFESSANNSKFT